MPTYVTLIHYTEQGIKTFNDLPARLEETRKVGEPLGANVVAYYLTMGRYDAIIDGREARARRGRPRQRSHRDATCLHRGRSQEDRVRVALKPIDPTHDHAADATGAAPPRGPAASQVFGGRVQICPDRGASASTVARTEGETPSGSYGAVASSTHSFAKEWISCTSS